MVGLRLRGVNEMVFLKILVCVALLLVAGVFGFFMGWLEDKYWHDKYDEEE